MTDDAQSSPRRRNVNHDQRDAQHALAAVVAKFPRWQETVAVLNAVAARKPTPAERNTILAECAGLISEVREARDMLIVTLADAPPTVARHGRVVDVERALDSIEKSLAVVKKRLSPN